LGAASWHTGQVTLKKASTTAPSFHGSVTGSPLVASERVKEGAESPGATSTEESYGPIPATLARFAGRDSRVSRRDMGDFTSTRAMRWWTGVAAVVLSGLLASACTGGASAQLKARPVQAQGVGGDSTTTMPPPDAEETTTTTAEPLPGMGVGYEGPEVLPLEQKLALLKYFVGQVDEAFDGDTRDAVTAFQKVTGMERTGRATDDVVAAVNAASGTPPPLIPGGGMKRVEIDLDRQVLFLFDNNNLSFILPVSTGSNQRFCSEGWCRRAVTPTGSFLIFSQRSGWERSPLGRLYNSQYFNGGIAIHGSPSVPPHPASHGCVRIPMSAAEWFPSRVSIGTPVYVVAAGEPLPAPIQPDSSPVSTPTTIVPDTVAPRTPRTTATTAATTTTTKPDLLDLLLKPRTTQP
jgi:peptidoglycan hydrolase-like protein with peptidoglycan-binding domain